MRLGAKKEKQNATQLLINTLKETWPASSECRKVK